jgi:hypothetical protein
VNYHGRWFFPDRALSAVRVIALRVRLRGRVEIDFATRVGAGCRIHVSRGGLLRLRGVNVTRDVTLDVSRHAILEVGRGGWLGAGSFLAAQQRISLGNGCMTGEYVSIRDHDHVLDAEHAMQDWSTGRRLSSSATTSGSAPRPPSSSGSPSVTAPSSVPTLSSPVMSSHTSESAGSRPGHCRHARRDLVRSCARPAWGGHAGEHDDVGVP